MQVGMAETATADFDSDLIGCGSWRGELAQLQRGLLCGQRLVELHGAHGIILGSGRSAFGARLRRLRSSQTKRSYSSRSFLLFALDELVTIQDILLRDDAFEFAEVGAMDDRQNGRGVHVTQCNFEREIGMEDGKALSRQGRSKRELTLPFSGKLCDHVFGYA